MQTRDVLAQRAAAEGMSMQEYLRELLDQVAAKPSRKELLARINHRKSLTETNVSAERIVALIAEDRR